MGDEVGSLNVCKKSIKQGSNLNFDFKEFGIIQSNSVLANNLA